MILKFMAPRRAKPAPPALLENFQVSGDRARDSRRWGDAVKFYRLHLADKPSDFEIWVQCGHSEKESGAFSAALDCYLEARTIRGDDADLSLQMGHLYKLMDREAEAVVSYQRCLALNPEDADARRELAALLQPAETPVRGQLEEAPAPAFFTAAREVHADVLGSDEELVARIAEERAKGESLTVAMLMRAYVRLSPTESPRWISLAETLRQIGDEGQARRCLSIADAIVRGTSPES